MFTLAGNFYRWVKQKREKSLTIILLGLDNAGKTTLLYGLRNELPQQDVTPTVGFNPHKLVTGKYTIHWFDVGGTKKFRSVWKSYYPEVHGVIYVVDAAERDRFEESRETLAKSLESEGVAGKPVLIFANKQDLDGCVTAADLTKELGMLEKKDCRYHVAACQAKPKEGENIDPRIQKGLKWLLDSIDSDYQKLNTRVEKETQEMKERVAKEKEERKKRAEASREARRKEQEEKERLEAAAAHKAAEEGPVAVAVDPVTPEKPAATSEQQDPHANGAMSQQAAAPATPMDNEIREKASLGEPGSEVKPTKLPALEVEGSVAPVHHAGGPKLSSLKPMPPPVNSPEPALPNAVPSPDIRKQDL